MADENQPEPTQRVRYTVPVTVDGVSYPADAYEIDLPESAAKELVAAKRVRRVRVVPQHEETLAEQPAEVPPEPEQATA